MLTFISKTENIIAYQVVVLTGALGVKVILWKLLEYLLS